MRASRRAILGGLAGLALLPAGAHAASPLGLSCLGCHQPRIDARSMPSLSRFSGRAHRREPARGARRTAAGLDHGALRRRPVRNRHRAAGARAWPRHRHPVSLSRRHFVGACAGFMGLRSRAAAIARIVVVGAGFGGATCARYLRLLCPAADVLLVDARAHFLTGPGRNLVVAGLRRRASLEIGLAHTGRSARVRTLCAEVARLDPVTRQSP